MPYAAPTISGGSALFGPSVSICLSNLEQKLTLRIKYIYYLLPNMYVWEGGA